MSIGERKEALARSMRRRSSLFRFFFSSETPNSFVPSLRLCCGLGCASAPLQVTSHTDSTGPLEFWKQKATGEGVKEEDQAQIEKREVEQKKAREGVGGKAAKLFFFFFKLGPSLMQEVRALLGFS